MAKLVIESKIKCDTYGKYAYACGSTWADAKSFAGAAYQAFASAWCVLIAGVALLSVVHHVCEPHPWLMSATSRSGIGSTS